MAGIIWGRISILGPSFYFQVREHEQHLLTFSSRLPPLELSVSKSMIGKWICFFSQQSWIVIPIRCQKIKRFFFNHHNTCFFLFCCNQSSSFHLWKEDLSPPYIVDRAHHSFPSGSLGINCFFFFPPNTSQKPKKRNNAQGCHARHARIPCVYQHRVRLTIPKAGADGWSVRCEMLFAVFPERWIRGQKNPGAETRGGPPCTW